MNRRPSIVIDCNSSRLRIHRQTLYALNSPDNILFLINPEKKMLAVQECASNIGERVRWISFGDKQCCELYSKPLILRIRKLFQPAWEPQMYKIYGRYIEKKNLVLFDLNKAILITAQEEFNND